MWPTFGATFRGACFFKKAIELNRFRRFEYEDRDEVKMKEKFFLIRYLVGNRKKTSVFRVLMGFAPFGIPNNREVMPW